MMRVVVTGAGGLLGWHTAARIHAKNCAARFNGEPAPFELVPLDHMAFKDDECLGSALDGAAAVLHFAGVNRASNEVIEHANPDIARRLAAACQAVGAKPHIVYANSTHSAIDTPYGRSKRVSGEILRRIGGRYTDLILPHIYGESARPRYNNVTATFIEAVIGGETPRIDPGSRVNLLHAGTAADLAIHAILSNGIGVVRPEGRSMGVTELYEILRDFHLDYSGGIFPQLSDAFATTLFNSYRAALYPDSFPRRLKCKSDARGVLFEAVKSGGGGQAFLSTTNSGFIRGDHFHLNKIERFLVVQGTATIRIRRVLSDKIWEYQVSGDEPVVVDMPTLHTHSIENIGRKPLLTFFWTNELFDPSAPDTFYDPVLQSII